VSVGKFGKVSVTVDRKEVSDIMSKLPRRLIAGIERRAVRKATKPYIQKLIKEWRTAKYKGKKLHRRAIANSIKLDGPRRAGSGKMATQRFAIGVDYAGKRGKGLQKVWHLLESGFRHTGPKRKNMTVVQKIKRVFGIRGVKVAGSFRSRRWANASVNRMFNDIADQILVEARKALR